MFYLLTKCGNLVKHLCPITVTVQNLRSNGVTLVPPGKQKYISPHWYRIVLMKHKQHIMYHFKNQNNFSL